MVIMTRERLYLYGGIGIMVLAVVIIGLLPAKPKEQTREVDVVASPEKIQQLRERLERLETLRWILTDETFQRIPQDLEMIAAETPQAPAN